MTTVRPQTTCTRSVAAPYDASIDVLTRSWRRDVEVTTDGFCRWSVDLPMGRWRRGVPVRVEVAPWAADGQHTGIELVPSRAVRPTARYFRAGHDLVEELATLISRALAVDDVSAAYSRSMMVTLA